MLADPTIEFAVIRITLMDGTIDPNALDTIFYAYQVEIYFYHFYILIIIKLY